ncbi:hypothetical protein D3C75_762870 [compost metagenome]
MAAGLAALGADQVGADRLPRQGLCHRGGGADHPAAGGMEARDGGRVEQAEGETDQRRGQLQQGFDLRAVVLAEARRPATGWQAQFGAQRIEACLGAGHFLVAGIGILEDEQVDVERAVGQRTHPCHPLAHRRRRQRGRGEGAQGAGVAYGGDQLRGGRAAGHGCLDQRMAYAGEGGERRVGCGHGVSSWSLGSP